MQKAHRNITNSGRCDLSFRWTEVHDGPRSAARLGKSLINQLQGGCHSGRCLGAKDGDRFPGSLSGERAVSQAIDHHRSQTSGCLDNVPGITANLLTLNGQTDPTAFENRWHRRSVLGTQSCPNNGSPSWLAKDLESVRETLDRAKAGPCSAGAGEAVAKAVRDIVHPWPSIERQQLQTWDGGGGRFPDDNFPAFAVLYQIAGHLRDDNGSFSAERFVVADPLANFSQGAPRQADLAFLVDRDTAAGSHGFLFPADNRN